ncbi:hypothetical protein NFI96_025670, partial [Prochilodus magdalenae]
VLSRALRVLLLCFLSSCLRETETAEVDQNTLAFIIKYIHQKYYPGEQFAVAINIPAEYCSGKIKTEDLQSVLKDDKPSDVKTAIIEYGTYFGTYLIGATTVLDTKSPKNKHTGKYPNLHSEYLLLKHPSSEESAMKDLLNKGKEGCVIFYTFMSPCDGTCLNKEMDRNILDALSIFVKHEGPKAFVYNTLFYYKEIGIKEHGVEINNNVPLYRCYPVSHVYECHHCVDGGKINEKCLVKKP